MTLPAVEMESPLWRFSLAVYRGAGVQEECLDMQERYGVNVNVLLFCAYVGAIEGAELSTNDLADILKVIGGWHGDIVGALRHARGILKPWGGFGEFAQLAATLRLKVKAAELEAEQIEQAMLWAWLYRHRSELRQQDVQTALKANVGALLVRCGAEEPNALKALPCFWTAALQARTRVTGTGP